MKNQIFILSLLIFSLIGCESMYEDPFRIPENATVFTEEIKSQELYTLKLGGMGMEDRRQIIEQPSEYELSRLGNIGIGLQIYQFRSKADYKGQETIIIKHCMSAGGLECVKELYTVVRLSIK